MDVFRAHKVIPALRLSQMRIVRCGMWRRVDW